MILREEAMKGKERDKTHTHCSEKISMMNAAHDDKSVKSLDDQFNNTST